MSQLIRTRVRTRAEVDKYNTWLLAGNTPRQFLHAQQIVMNEASNTMVLRKEKEQLLDYKIRKTIEDSEVQQRDDEIQQLHDVQRQMMTRRREQEAHRELEDDMTRAQAMPTKTAGRSNVDDNRDRRRNELEAEVSELKDEIEAHARRQRRRQDRQHDGWVVCRKRDCKCQDGTGDEFEQQLREREDTHQKFEERERRSRRRGIKVHERGRHESREDGRKTIGYHRDKAKSLRHQRLTNDFGTLNIF